MRPKAVTQLSSKQSSARYQNARKSSPSGKLEDYFSSLCQFMTVQFQINKIDVGIV